MLPLPNVVSCSQQNLTDALTATLIRKYPDRPRQTPTPIDFLVLSAHRQEFFPQKTPHLEAVAFLYRVFIYICNLVLEKNLHLTV